VLPATPTETAAPTAAPTPEPEPTPEAQTYVVESGDTLGAIARRFGTTVAEIVEASGLEDPDRLAIGDELVIPSAGAPAVEAPAATEDTGSDGAADDASPAATD
jgi:LysM repeat protein